MNTETLRDAIGLLDEYAERFETYSLEDGSFALTAHWRHGGQKVFVSILEVLRWVEEHPSGSWKGERMKRRRITLKDAPIVADVAAKVFLPPAKRAFKVLWKIFLFYLVISLSIGVVVLIMFLLSSQSDKKTSPVSYEAAMQELLQQAKNGNAKISSGYMLFATEGTIEEIQKKAENGDAVAQFALGAIYQMGYGNVRQDYKEAFRWLTRAAKQDDAQAQCLLGIMHYEGQGVRQDYKEALKWFHLAAEQGFANAQLLLCVMYSAGQGVPQDYSKAVKWCTKAAEQDYAPAQFTLGRMYDNSEVVPKNLNEAFKWYQMAAKQGWPPAQYDLGLMCAERKDYVEAYKWLILAHKNGEDTSEANLLLQNILSPNEVTEAENLAKAFVEHKSATPFTSDTIEGFYKGAKSLR